ncbi:MAG TPA: cytochrome C, partial [Syntrophus sp. (in: bacteria)]|nr:cytochrome C [Syntrophus sp. (in: bacteria)]
MLFIAVCLPAVSAVNGIAGDTCTLCHQVTLKGIHAALPCTACHGDKVKAIGKPASMETRAVGCVGCHRGYEALFDHAMATRTKERRFVERTVGRIDPAFFQQNCNSCHLRGCTDCHGGTGHAIAKATEQSCLACHKGYF